MLWHLCILAGLGSLVGGQPVIRHHQLAPLASAALKLLEEQVSPSQSTLAVIGLSKGERHPDREQEELMTSILKGIGDSMALRIFEGAPPELPSRYSLFLVNSAEAFSTLSFEFADLHTARENNFLILLTRSIASKVERQKVLRNISRTCLSFHTLNVILLSQQSQDLVLTYGYRIYNKNCDRIPILELIDSYENGSFRGGHRERSFDRVLLSLAGCPMRISWYPLAPFVSFEGNVSDPEELSQTWRLTGIDGELIKMLAEIFNFTIQLEEPCQKCLSPDIKDECSGCFDQMLNSTSSILIGAMSGSHQHRKLFSATTSYHQSAMVFVLHMETKLGAMALLAVPFCYGVWMALVVCGILVVLVIYARRRLKCPERAELAEPALQVLTTLMGNPLVAATVPRNSLVRVLVATWLLMVLVLRVIYQGKLYDSFRMPYGNSLPRQISQLIAANYTLSSQEFLEFYPRNLTMLTRNGSWERFDHIEEVGDYQRITTTSLIASLSEYNRINWNTSRLTHMKEHILLYQLVIYLRRHSLLKFAFDRKIKQLLSAGIIGYLVREFDSTEYSVPYSEPHEVSALPLEVFCGLFYISSILLSSAVIAFGLELLSLRIKWLTRYFE
ncbi:hypothetical protein KR009_010108 [Drosophila setifemur]|nr:hypothetical protein KR009_010108 [Drosophila setifemur]